MDGDRELGNISLHPGGAHGGASGGVQVPAAVQQAAQDAAQQAAQQAAQDAARGAASQAASVVSSTVRAGASEISLYVQANPYSITLLSFIGGAALTVWSILGIFWVPGLVTHPLQYVLQFYQGFFGCIILAIDGPASSMFPTLSRMVLQYASFMANNNSRAAYYLFLACFEGNLPYWFHQVLGWYFAVVAVLYILVQLTQPRAARNVNTASAPLAAA